MARYIDADKLKPDTKTFTSAYSEELIEFYSQKAIDNAPTADVAPVKHGEWMGSVCSACGESTSFYYDCCYCPQCGAKMD